jgi:S1-C subfamily serine protease
MPYARQVEPAPGGARGSGQGVFNGRSRPGDPRRQDQEVAEQAPPLPTIVRPHGGGASQGAVVSMPLPAVIHPTEPSQPGGTAGTGFFITPDAMMLTAAHVVQGCKQAQIFSRYLPRARATVVATDDTSDLALLRATIPQPPAILPLGRMAGSGRNLLVIGYPGGGDAVTATETDATLQNYSLPRSIGPMAEVGQMVWLHNNNVIRQGFSGGPIVDLATGTVVGLVRATIKDGALAQVKDMPASGLAIGPGSSQLSAFLNREAPFLSREPGLLVGGLDRERARRATVHVLCVR